MADLELSVSSLVPQHGNPPTGWLAISYRPVSETQGLRPRLSLQSSGKTRLTIPFHLPVTLTSHF